MAQDVPWVRCKRLTPGQHRLDQLWIHSLRECVYRFYSHLLSSLNTILTSPWRHCTSYLARLLTPGVEMHLSGQLWPAVTFPIPSSEACVRRASDTRWDMSRHIAFHGGDGGEKSVCVCLRVWKGVFASDYTTAQQPACKQSPYTEKQPVPKKSEPRSADQICATWRPPSVWKKILSTVYNLLHIMIIAHFPRKL